MPTYVELPANLVSERDTTWKTQYWTEYCERAKRKLLPRRAPHKVTIKTSSDLPLTRSFMKDHFPEFGSLELKRDYERTLMTLGKKMVLKDRPGDRVTSPVQDADSVIEENKNTNAQDIPLEDSLPNTMAAIEKAWMEEVNSNKRERGNVYGNAGKKTYLSRPKTSPATCTRTMPGMKKWLETANEHEKQVVYTFLDSVSRSVQNNVPADEKTEQVSIETKKVRVSSAPVTLKQYTPASSCRGSRCRSAASISSNSSKGSNHVTLDLCQQPIKSHLSANETQNLIHGEEPLVEPIRRTKSAVTLREIHNEEMQQRPLTSSSRSSDSRSSNTPNCKNPHKHRHNHSHSHTHSHTHTKTKCTRCRDNAIKSMIKDIESDDVSPYDQNFPGIRTPNRNRFYNTSAYYANEPDDYVHQHSLFTNAPKGNRGYFIIHPDWVSEYKQCRPSYR